VCRGIIDCSTNKKPKESRRPIRVSTWLHKTGQGRNEIGNWEESEKKRVSQKRKHTLGKKRGTQPAEENALHKLRVLKST